MPKPARSRTKACESCHQTSETLYRVMADPSKVWKMMCPTCRIEAEKQPSYRYGGTWKADKRH